jgi:hypothetical protein
MVDFTMDLLRPLSEARLAGARLGKLQNTYGEASPTTDKALLAAAKEAQESHQRVVDGCARLRQELEGESNRA